jgi:heat-inducible transcriptional repressor
MQAAVQAGTEAWPTSTEHWWCRASATCWTVQDFGNDLGSACASMFDLFEQKTQLMRLLDGSSRPMACASTSAAKAGGAVRRAVGGLGAVRVDGQVVGTLGVIGPTRMAYDRMIQMVDITSRLVGNALSQK